MVVGVLRTDIVQQYSRLVLALSSHVFAACSLRCWRGVAA